MKVVTRLSGSFRPIMRAKYSLSTSAPVTEKSQAAEPSATNLSIDDVKSGEKEIGANKSDDDNNIDANGETDGSRPTYQGKIREDGGAEVVVVVADLEGVAEVE